MTVEERIKQQRALKLIDLGYCTREYCPDPDLSNDYPLFDEEEQQHYRLVADEVTDEQFQRIIAIGGEHGIESTNTLATTLTVLGWITCIIFCLVGFSVAQASRGFNFVLLLTWCAIGVGCLLSLLWFAEVLKLLQRIHDKL